MKITATGLEGFESELYFNMRRFICRLQSLFVLSLCFYPFTFISQADAQPADPLELVNKVYEAIGGIERIEAVTSLHAKGSVRAMAGFPGTVEIWRKSPEKYRIDWDVGVASRTIAYDGENGWERNQHVREIIGDDLFRLKLETPMWLLPRCVSFARTRTLELGGTEGGSEYLLNCEVYDNLTFTFAIDPSTYLVSRIEWTEPHLDGWWPVVVKLDDYRDVDGILFPFNIEEERKGIPLAISLDNISLNELIPDDRFANPHQDEWSDNSIEVELNVYPRRVFKEIAGMDKNEEWFRVRDIEFPYVENWVFNVIVSEKLGRQVEPKSVDMGLYSGEDLIQTIHLKESAIKRLAKFPVIRWANEQPPEIFDFRHEMSHPGHMKIDRIQYKLGYAERGGRLRRKRTKYVELSIPVESYEQKAELIFPVKGNFVVTNGHEFFELGHKFDPSQHFAYDIVGLGPEFQLTRNNGAKNSDYYTFNKTEVLAPAAGKVVFARNDVTDERWSSHLFSKENGLTAMGGNLIVIDHGNDEVSLFAHNAMGSVTVKTGDVVEQGQVIAKIGGSGTTGEPHLHYQLMSDETLFGGIGLPSTFTNVETAGYGEGRKVKRPIPRGFYRAY